MSAWVVDKRHIDAMLTAALSLRGASPSRRFQWRAGGEGAERRELGTPVASERLAEVGTMLLAENERSVRARYADADAAGMIPGEPYEYEPTREPTAVEAAKLVDCFEYQACEHREWEGSEAWWFCYALRRALLDRLVTPGYDDAPWGWQGYAGHPQEAAA